MRLLLEDWTLTFKVPIMKWHLFLKKNKNYYIIKPFDWILSNNSPPSIRSKTKYIELFDSKA